MRDKLSPFLNGAVPKPEVLPPPKKDTNSPLPISGRLPRPDSAGDYLQRRYIPRPEGAGVKEKTVNSPPLFRAIRGEKGNLRGRVEENDSHR